MANDDRSLVPVPSYLRDLYQLITLLLSDRRVAGIADFRALSEVNHEAEVNRFAAGDAGNSDTRPTEQHLISCSSRSIASD